MISVEEAKNIVLTVADSSYIPIHTSVGKVSSFDVKSPINIPALPTSTRDGFGWNTKWTTSKCNILPTESLASPGSKELYNAEFEEGKTIYIATGGIVPKAFDTVIMMEDCTYEDGTPLNLKELKQQAICMNGASYASGKFIRQVGSDLAINDEIVKKGDPITSGHVGIIASVGIKSLFVQSAMPKQSLLAVNVLSTGDEVVDSGESLPYGCVYDSNRPMLLSYLQNYDMKDTMILKDLGIVRDDPDSLRNTIQANIHSFKTTVFIGSGGASVGKKDFVLSTLKSLGCQILITKVNMMPGKPFLFAVHPNFVYFGLAGNPVASGVSFKLYVEPFLKRLKGLPAEHRTTNVRLAFSAKSGDPSRPEYHRVTLKIEDGQVVAYSTGKQASSTLKSLVCADALVRVDAVGGVNMGDIVEAIIISDFKPPQVFKIGVLTASDRASANIYEDKSGANIKEWCKANFVTPHEIVYRCVRDEEKDIEDAILQMVEEGCGLILTTGGTGPAKRDVTVNVMKRILDRELPGFGEQMRAMSLKYVPTAILSAQTSGIIYRKHSDGGSLVINLPGSPKSINECLDVVKGAIPYCVALCGGGYIETDPPAYRGKK
jgi:molybdenum cofactor synthesis domain-containing protein